MAGRLEDRVATVTGAGNGVGRACALAIAREGAKVVVNDLGTDELGEGRSSQAADRTVAEIEEAGGTAIASYESVAEFSGAGRVVEAALDHFDRIDIAVNCAGAALGSSLFEATEDSYHRTIALQMSQKWYVAKHAVPHMARQRWGRIVNTCSHGAWGYLGKPDFAAGMGGVVSMTKALATETAALGITVNCLAPGAATRLHRFAYDEFKQMREEGLIDDDTWQAYLDTPPAECVAPIAAWLCTDAASHVTGEVFSATGNKIARWSSYVEECAIYRGDHASTPPWTLDELDALVPSQLVPGK